MLPIKPQASTNNLIPLLPRNRLAPSTGYDSLVDDWLNRSRSPHTKRMYRSNIDGFFKYLGVDLTADNLALFLLLDTHQAFELVSQYQGSLIARNLAPATINQKLAAIKSLVNYASCAGKCHYSLVNIKAERLHSYRDTRGISIEEFKLMLATVNPKTIKGIRDRAILLLLWGNALRRSEVVNCDVSDFSDSRGELLITGKGKIGQPEIISLGKSAIVAIELWLSKRGNYKYSDPLFTAIHKSYWGHRLNSHSIYKLVQKYAKLADVEKVMSPHRIRHSAITESLNLTNGDVRKVQKLSRHKKLDTLMIYDDNRTSLQGEMTDLLDDLI